MYVVPALTATWPEGVAGTRQNCHRCQVKAIETTAVLDEEARIVPRTPLSERPAGEFRVILLLEEESSASPAVLPQTNGDLLSLAHHAEPMGLLSSRDIDRI